MNNIISIKDRACFKGYRYILLYITIFLYLYLFYDCGINHWDEGIGPNGALRLLNGEKAGIDFLAYAPGRYYLFMGSFHAFGATLLSARRVMVALSAFMPLLGYLIAKEVMDKPFAALASALILSAPSVYYNRFFPIFTLVNLYFLIRSIKDGNRRSFIILLISILVTFLFRIEVALITIFCIPLSKREPLCFFNKKNIIWAIFFISVFVLYIASEPKLINYFNYRLYAIFSMHEKWGNPFPSLYIDSFLNAGSFFTSLDSLLFYLPMPLYLFSIIISYKKNKGSMPSKDISVIIISVFGIGTFGLVIWRAGFDNLLRVLPSFYIILCFLLSICYNVLNSYCLKRSYPFVRIIYRQLLFALPLFPLLLIYNFTVNHGFYAGSIGALFKNDTLLPIPAARVYTTEREAEAIVKIVSFIKKETERDDYIFCVPLHPLFYFLSGRKNPTFYEWILPGSLKGSYKEQEMIVEELRKKRPKVVILSDIAIDQKEKRRFSRYADMIYRYIKNNYRLVKQVGIFSLLRIKNG